jgi:hypothetical protein
MIRDKGKSNFKCSLQEISSFLAFILRQEVGIKSQETP